MTTSVVVILVVTKGGMVSLSPANGALHEVWSRFEHVKKKHFPVSQGHSFRERDRGKEEGMVIQW